MDTEVAQPIRWIAPDLIEAVPSPPEDRPVEILVETEAPPLLPEEERQALIASAREDGFKQGWEQGHTDGLAQGHREGMALGQTEIQRLSHQLQAIIDNFTHPLRRLENEVIHALGTLAVRVAGYLVRRSYTARPSLMQALINEALQAASSDSGAVEIRLHPEDLTALQPLLSLEPGQRLVADEHLQRGDVRVHAASVRIDASIDSRLDRVIEHLLRSKDASI